MKTVITVWNDRVSPVFDVAGQALLFDAQGAKVCSEQVLMLSAALASEKVASLVELGTQVLICGAISRDAYSAASESGIRVYPFIARNVCEVIQALLAGRLEEAAFAMPGCACRRGFSGRGRHDGGRKWTTGSAFYCRKQTDSQEV